MKILRDVSIVTITWKNPPDPRMNRVVKKFETITELTSIIQEYTKPRYNEIKVVVRREVWEEYSDVEEYVRRTRCTTQQPAN